MKEFFNEDNTKKVLEKLQGFKESLINYNHDFWDLIEILEEIPEVIEVKVDGSDDKEHWDNFDKLDEPSWTRIKIQKIRGIKNPDAGKITYDILKRKVWFEVWGILSLISEEFSGTIGPSFVIFVPHEEWTNDYINMYIRIYNSYGS